ncbi:MAG: penicillin-binding protein 2 [Pseudomonadota bacterium]|nr:penicillin-binding protein 2 [Pseudomonadota bacterium]
MKNHLQNNYRSQQHSHFIRTIYSLIFFLLLTSLLVYRLYMLQITSGQNLYIKSLNNQYTFASLQPQRGEIFDRNGVVLAKNIPKFHLDLIVESKKQSKETMNFIAQKLNLDLDFDKLNKKIDTAKFQDSIRLLSYLSQEQIQTLYFENLHLHSIRITPEFIRHYPCRSACAAVTGYVLAKKVAKDIKSDNPNILANYSGADGVEKHYNDILSGQSGLLQLQRNAKGNILKKISNIPAQNGSDITLTIDYRLQKLLEKTMEGKNGAVIISNPRNGEILALYSSPSYDPNAFLDPLLKHKIGEYLTSETKPLFNRALSGHFPPASTVKPFLTLHALDNRIIDQNFTIYDTGSFQYKGTSNIYRNWHRQGHGYVNTRKAIIVSNDTFFYHLSLKLGIDTMSEIYRQYGFGMPTNIDLPGEKPGLLPNREWKKSQGKPWLIGDTIITGIGQGALLVTPLQLSFATSIFASKGKTFYPHVLKHISTSEKPIIETKTPFQSTHHYNSENWDYIVSAMQKVVEYGTGKRFGKLPVPFAAKTGTAQLVKNSGRRHHIKSLSDHSWLIGFVAKKSPDFAITVLVENDNLAILVAKDIIDAHFSKETEFIPMD